MMASTVSQRFSVGGKTAIVTGGGSGINYNFAKLLLEKGCNVVIGDLSLRPEAQALIDKYTTSPRALFAPTDVTNWDALERLFAVADSISPHGADIVCPGAGVFEPAWSNFWHPPGSTRSRDSIHGTATEGVGHYATLDINLTHPIRCTQMAIARWLNLKAGSGGERASTSNPKRVVHISSIAGQAPGFSHPLYTASKHALSGLIRSLGPLEEKMGIRVNGVAPGLIRTPLFLDNPDKLAMLDQEKDEWVEPEDVALAMLRCVEEENLKGGSVLEVTKDATRLVDWKMDPGPQGKGSSASNRHIVTAETFSLLEQDGWGASRAS